MHDSTTGLYNATFFRQYLGNLFGGEGTRSGVLVLVSIDDLQRVNFRYGNKAGTQVVTTVATLLKNAGPPNTMYAKVHGC